MNKPTLGIVIPCLNEQDLIKSTITKLITVINKLSKKEKISTDSFLYIVDDGSKDNTWQIIKELNEQNSQVKGLKLTKNFGNQNALLAGLLSVRKLNPDCIITIDADLQQDENTIEEFITKFQNGAEIVSGIRNNRKTESFFKKLNVSMFYFIMNILGVNLIENHSDYRLISKKGLDILAEYKEVNLFLRGIFNDFGLKTDHVYFDVKERSIGKSRFNIPKLFALAINGITSFSILPLRLVAILGILMSLFSFGLALEVLFEKYMLKSTIPGWTTIIIAICFTGGVQILCIGIIGEYLGKVYNETKARPRFIKDTELL